MRASFVPQTAPTATRWIGSADTVENVRSSLQSSGARVLISGAPGCGARRLCDTVCRAEWRASKLQWWADASSEASFLLALSEFGWRCPECCCADTGDGATVAAATKLLSERDDWLLVLEGGPVLAAPELAAMLARIPADRGRVLITGPDTLTVADLGLTAQHPVPTFNVRMSAALLFTAAGVESFGWEADEDRAAAGYIDPGLEDALGNKLQNFPLGIALLGKLASAATDANPPTAQSVRLRAPVATAEVTAGMVGKGTEDPKTVALHIGLACLRKGAGEASQVLVCAESLLYTIALLARYGCSAVPEELFVNGNWTEELSEGGGAVAERVPGKQLRKQAKETLVEDRSVVACQLCSAVFSVFRRRHHCRQCGRVVCGPCSKSKAELPRRGHDHAVRLCDKCAQTAQKQDSPSSVRARTLSIEKTDTLGSRHGRIAKEQKKTLSAALQIWSRCAGGSCESTFDAAAQALVDAGLLDWSPRQIDVDLPTASHQGVLRVHPALVDGLLKDDGTAPVLCQTAGGSLPASTFDEFQCILCDIVGDWSRAVRAMTCLHSGRTSSASLSTAMARSRRKAARLYPVAAAVLKMVTESARMADGDAVQSEEAGVLWRAGLAGALARCLVMNYQSDAFVLAEHAFQMCLQLIEAGPEDGRQTIGRNAAAEAHALMNARPLDDSNKAPKEATGAVQKARASSPPVLLPLANLAAGGAEFAAVQQCDDLEALGHMFLQQGRAAPAAQLLGAVVRMRAERSGGLHEETLACTALWARALEASGNWERSIEAHVRNLRVLEHVLGKVHPLVAAACDTIASTCERQAAATTTDTVDFDLALAMRLRSLSIRSRSLGRDHDETGASAKRLALTYLTAAHAVVAYNRHADLEPHHAGVKLSWHVSSRLSPDALHQAILRFSALSTSELPYKSIGDMDPTALVASNRWKDTHPAQALDSMDLDTAATAAMAAQVCARRRGSCEPKPEPEPEPEPEV